MHTRPARGPGRPAGAARRSGGARDRGPHAGREDQCAPQLTCAARAASETECALCLVTVLDFSTLFSKRRTSGMGPPGRNNDTRLPLPTPPTSPTPSATPSASPSAPPCSPAPQGGGHLVARGGRRGGGRGRPLAPPQPPRLPSARRWPPRRYEEDAAWPADERAFLNIL